MRCEVLAQEVGAGVRPALVLQEQVHSHVNQLSNGPRRWPAFPFELEYRASITPG